MSFESQVVSRRARVRADLILFSVALIWGSSFAIQRFAAAHIGPFLYNGIRFLFGALTLLPMALRRWQKPTRREWVSGTGLGLLLVAASVLQQAGMQHTTAGKAGFITGLYVVLVPLFLALGWRQWPRWSTWVASLVAVVGLFLLSMSKTLVLAPGDGLEVIGSVLWALHVILIGRLAGRVDTLRLSMMQYLSCGLTSTLLGLILEWQTLGGLAAVWWAVVYGGVFSVGLGFTLQVVGQKVAPATDAAILLSMEAVFAALSGWVFLDEVLSPRQILGCVLMFTSMLLAQAAMFGRDRKPSPVPVGSPGRSSAVGD